MTWLKSDWRWTMFNLFAASTLAVVLTQGSTDWNRPDTFDSMLESGKWAIRLLLTSLAITPLNTYFGWREAVKLRKPAGLWAFGFASLHVLYYIREAKLEWLTVDMPIYLMLGLAGIGVLSALAVTSNRWAMQRLGKNWKRLHRFVYLAGMAVVTHSMLATMMSKKVFLRDPQAPNELKVYAAILSVLLVVRIPLVRQLLQQIPNLLKHHRTLVRPVAAGNGEVELWPRIHGRESSVSVEPTFIIRHETTNHSERSNLNKVLENILESSHSYGNQSVEITPEGEIKEISS